MLSEEDRDGGRNDAGHSSGVFHVRFFHFSSTEELPGYDIKHIKPDLRGELPLKKIKNKVKKKKSQTYD